MLFQALVIFLPISIFFKILSNGGKVHFGYARTRKTSLLCKAFGCKGNCLTKKAAGGAGVLTSLCDDSTLGLALGLRLGLGLGLRLELVARNRNLRRRRRRKFAFSQNRPM